jgi:hypothetical protein
MLIAVHYRKTAAKYSRFHLKTGLLMDFSYRFLPKASQRLAPITLCVLKRGLQTNCLQGGLLFGCRQPKILWMQGPKDET